MRTSLVSDARVKIALFGAIAAAGCGDDHVAKVSMPAVEAAADGRLVVAEVNGRPVFDDCVTIQMRETGVDRHAALQQCIDFELLAQRAEERGYGEHPEVLRTQRREAIRALIDKEFLPEFDGPEDVPEAAVEAHWKTNHFDYDYPEYRFAAHALAAVERGVSPGSEPDRRAYEVAEELYRWLGPKHRDMDDFWQAATGYRARRLLIQLCTGLEALEQPTLDDVLDLLHRVLTEPEIVVQKLPQGMPKGGGGRYARAFADAVFALPEEGMVSPPTRTRLFGWHVILLARIVPEQHETFAEAEPEIREDLFPRAQQAAFYRWMTKLVEDRQVEIHERTLAQMVAAERARDPLRSLDENRP